MDQYEEYSTQEERFYHEDEFNQDYSMELHRKDSYEGSEEESDTKELTRKKSFSKKLGNIVKVGAITVTTFTVIITTPTIHVHTISDYWKMIVEPTCISYGKEEKTCTVCGKTLDSQLVGYSGHNAGEWIVSVPSNCTHTGTEEQTCTVCGELIDQRETALGDHVLGDWQILHEETCTEDGHQVILCTMCNEELERQSIPASHVIVIDDAVSATCYHTGLSKGSHCSRCGAIIEKQSIIPISHSIVVIKGYAPTCRENGLSDGQECSICGKLLVAQKVLAAAHTPKKVAGYPADCSTWETGLTDGSVCSVCGYIITQQTVIEPSHKEEVYIPNGWPTKPTCTEGVSGMGRCKVCGMETSTYIEISAPLGHNYVDKVITDDTGMTNVWRQCSRCGQFE